MTMSLPYSFNTRADDKISLGQNKEAQING